MAVSSEIARAGLSRWEPGPARPSLAPGVVHVWRADLTTVDDAALGWLTAEEHERAAGILNARKARLWARSRGVLRQLLGRYTGLSPGAITLRLGLRGKPELDGREGTGVFFNVSHSGSLALFALSQAGPVGVDVERGRAPLEGHVSRAASGTARKDRLNAPDSRTDAEFLRRWTRAEAIGKCLGGGIGVEATSMPLGPNAPRASGVWVRDLDLGGHAVGAIAASRAPAAILRLRWCG